MKNGWIEDISGTKYHYVNDQIHCDDGPAVVYYDGDKEWFINGKRHRENGPACEYSMSFNRCKTYWYYNGEHIICSTLEEFKALTIFKAFI